jgi:hypothetical protein
MSHRDGDSAARAGSRARRCMVTWRTHGAPCVTAPLRVVAPQVLVPLVLAPQVAPQVVAPQVVAPQVVAQVVAPRRIRSPQPLTLS